jgi:hypothetical protein
MKKIAIMIVITLASCNEKAKEIPKNKTQDEMVKEAAMPYIAKEIGELDFNVTIARDKTQDSIFRYIAIDKIRQNGAEYLYSATIENIYSRDFERRLENQKKLIITNWREIERNRQYKQSAIEQFKK